MGRVWAEHAIPKAEVGAADAGAAAAPAALGEGEAAQASRCQELEQKLAQQSREHAADATELSEQYEQLQAELRRQLEERLDAQSRAHAGEVSALSATCEQLRLQLHAMHASAGALAAAQPAGASAMHREGLGRARAAQLSAQLMTEHVAVAALRGEVASSEHALLAQRQRHAAELAAEQSVRAQQTEQLMAMHQAASALGSVASSQRSKDEEVSAGLRRQIASAI